MSETNGTANGVENILNKRKGGKPRKGKGKPIGKGAFYEKMRSLCETKTTTLSTEDKAVSVTLKSFPEVDAESLKDAAEDGFQVSYKREETVSGKTVAHKGKAAGAAGRELLEAFIALDAPELSDDDETDGE